MVKYIKSSAEYAPEDIWEAVCSGDIAKIKAYYENGGAVNLKYPAFGTNHSLIMGAVRNHNFDAANLLADYGEDISHKEALELYHLLDNLERGHYDQDSVDLEEELSGLADLMDKLGM